MYYKTMVAKKWRGISNILAAGKKSFWNMLKHDKIKCRQISEFFAYLQENLFKPRPGRSASGHIVIGLFVRLSVCLSVRNSVSLTKIGNNLNFGDDTVTKLGLLVHLLVSQTSLTFHTPWGVARLKCGTLRYLHYFDIVAAWGIRYPQHVSS